MQNNITFILFTFNEEKRISYVIRNFIKYGEVMLFDGGSTDKTQEIAESLGAKFFTRPPNNKAQVETETIFNFIKERVKTDWIYWGYTDNIAPKSLVEKMVDISRQEHYKMVLVPLFTYLWGDTTNFALKSHGQFLFHKDYLDFSKNYIHGMGAFKGTPDQALKWPLKGEYALRHFSTYNIKKFVMGHLNYGEAEALEKFERGKKYSTSRMLAAMARYCWIYRRSLRAGALGLIIMLSYAFFRLMTYARLYELEHGITLDSIEDNYSKEKEKILREFN
jgi:glycosyltransferase involved in cell wall biosynthesis